MENQSLYDPNLHGDSAKVEDYRFNHIAFCDALQHSRANDPRFKNVALEDMAEIMGLSRSNFQRLRKGNVPDPKSSTIWLICTTLRIAPYKLMGLPAPAPEADQEKPSASAAMERHMRDLERRDEINTKELDRLRKLVLQESKAASTAQEQARSLEKLVASKDAELNLLRRRRVMLLIMIAVLLLIVAYCVSEITDPYSGLTQLFM